MLFRTLSRQVGMWKVIQPLSSICVQHSEWISRLEALRCSSGIHDEVATANDFTSFFARIVVFCPPATPRSSRSDCDLLVWKTMKLPVIPSHSILGEWQLLMPQALIFRGMRLFGPSGLAPVHLANVARILFISGLHHASNRAVCDIYHFMKCVFTVKVARVYFIFSCIFCHHLDSVWSTSLRLNWGHFLLPAKGLGRHRNGSKTHPFVVDVKRSYMLWHCWLGHLTRKNPSPIWPIMCLVGR